jgi:hypothetical protein
MVNNVEHLNMKTKVEHVIERNYDKSIYREIYRVIVSEERPTSSGTHVYDHTVWVGECKAVDWEWMKRFSRKHGARFRGVQIKTIDTDYFHERD